MLPSHLTTKQHNLTLHVCYTTSSSSSNEVYSESERYGMHINVDKTKTMVLGKKD